MDRDTKEKLISNQVVFGAFALFPEPGHVEILTHAGCDFVVIDLEHAALDWGISKPLL